MPLLLRPIGVARPFNLIQWSKCGSTVVFGKHACPHRALRAINVLSCASGKLFFPSLGLVCNAIRLKLHKIANVSIRNEQVDFSSLSLFWPRLTSLPFDGLARDHVSVADDALDYLWRLQFFLNVLVLTLLRRFLHLDDKPPELERNGKGGTALTYGFGTWLTALSAIFTAYVPIEKSIAELLTSTFATSSAGFLFHTTWIIVTSKASRIFGLFCKIDVRRSSRVLRIARRAGTLLRSKPQISTVQTIECSSISVTRSLNFSSVKLIVWSAVSHTLATVANESIPGCSWEWAQDALAFFSFLAASPDVEA